MVYAPEAIDQLEALLDFLTVRSSLRVAMRYVEAVVSTCQALSMFPKRGMSREDIRPRLRLTHHRGRTVIAYSVDDVGALVTVVGIFYGGQDHEAALATG